LGRVPSRKVYQVLLFADKDRKSGGQKADEVGSRTALSPKRPAPIEMDRRAPAGIKNQMTKTA
jgi:hypothetical protein